MTFCVVEYLNCLSNNAIEINLSSKGLTELPDLSKFVYLEVLNCSNNKLTSISFLPKNLEVLNCSNNRLTVLPELNRILEILNCSNNQLTNLPELNYILEGVNCSNNQLTTLPKLNDHLQRLDCSNNQLTTLPKLNDHLERLDCSRNKITNLPKLNDNLEICYCTYNNINRFNSELNETVYTFYFEENPICDIIGTSNDIQIIKRNINIMNKFRILYYHLKYKSKFRKWLWEKVREKRNMEKYSPKKLVELLNQLGNEYTEDERENLLNNW